MAHARLAYRKFACFEQSVLSPERAPLTISRSRARHIQSALFIDRGILSTALSNQVMENQDLLGKIITSAWLNDERAPRLASINKVCSAMSSQTQVQLVSCNVAPMRPYMKAGVNDSFMPELTAEENTTITSWGEKLEHFHGPIRIESVNSASRSMYIDVGDFQRVLDGRSASLELRPPRCC
jgi:hypothetical protein